VVLAHGGGGARLARVAVSPAPRRELAPEIASLFHGVSPRSSANAALASGGGSQRVGSPDTGGA
jgi:hypothetical protein